MTQKFMKRLYNVETFQRFIADAVASFGDMRKSRKNPDISAAFSSRILLAVTHVNGCRYCSFVHTKNALEEGVSEDEVQGLLGGEFDAAPSNESVALLYAEHYADSAGQPSPESTQKLIEAYGTDTAAQILGIIRGIMVGNLHGNMIDALRNRISRKPAPESNL
ncbi:MAG: carboxymuconolactone decarboxylase family protein, partial [Thiothrix litoralis]